MKTGPARYATVVQQRNVRVGVQDGPRPWGAGNPELESYQFFSIPPTLIPQLRSALELAEVMALEMGLLDEDFYTLTGIRCVTNPPGPVDSWPKVIELGGHVIGQAAFDAAMANLQCLDQNPGGHDG